MDSHVVWEINYPYFFDRNIEDPIIYRPKRGVYHDEEQRGRRLPCVGDTDAG